MAVNTNFDVDVVTLVDTLSAGDKLTINNSIFSSTFLSSDIAERHTVITDVHNGDVIPIIDDSVNYATFPFLDQSSCASNTCDLGLNMTGKKWDLGLVNCKVPICMRTFSKDFLYFWQTNKQVLHEYGQDSALLKFVQKKFEDNLRGAAWRVAYFADTTTPALDPNFGLLGQVNGFFTQAEAGAGKKYLFDQLTPTGQEAYDALEKAYADMMTQPWVSKEGMVWKMTSKMASVLVRWLNGMKDKSQYNCECYSPDGITALRTFSLNGTLNFFGIPVEIERDLDGIISQLALDRPYRALLTYRSNLLIGTQATEDLGRFDLWYSKDTKMVYIEGEAYIGASLVEDNYIYIGAEVASV